MAPVMRHLLLMRHAKAAYPEGVADHERPLAGRGRREAALAGDWIRAHHHGLDAALCSGAVRARETLEATGVDAPPTFTDAIYEASPGDILEQLSLVCDDVRRLLVIGHAPGIPNTALMLANDENDLAARRELQRHFPTSAIAVLEFGGAWSDITKVGARIVAFEIPR